MTCLRIDAGGRGLTDGSGASADYALDAALSRSTGPVTIMVHGFKYAPDHPGRCPHRLIFRAGPSAGSRRSLSWARHLGAARDDRLVIAFGWPGRGSIWTAARQGHAAARALSALIGRLHRRGRPASLVAHSLGGALALDAVAEAQAGSVDRVVLMVPAAFARDARRAVESPAGRQAQFLNVTTRENLLFDALFWAALGAGRGGGRPLAQGLRAPPPNWADLAIDRAATRRRLSVAGMRLAAPVRRVCHWSPYLRPGVFGIYRRFLAHDLDTARLRALLHDPLAPRTAWPGRLRC